MLAYLAFMLFKTGPQGLSIWRELLWGRTIDLVCALMLVEALVLARTVRQQPPMPAQPKRFLLVMLPFALLPMVLAGVALASSNLAATFGGVATTGQLMVGTTVLLRVIGFGLPTVVLWLLTALDTSAHQSLSAVRVLLEAGRFTLRGLRDWSPIVIVLAGYWWAASDTTAGLDAVIESIDRVLLFGHDIFALLAPITVRPLSEWMAFCYTFYAALFPLVASAVLWKSGRVALQETFFALGAAFLVSYVSYTLVPVKGPLLYRTFDVPVALTLFAPLKEALMDQLRVTWDCFPSMHTCATVLMAWQSYRWARRLFWALLPVYATIPLACVYLRYHWVTDVLAGFGLAWLVARLTMWVTQRTTSPAPLAASAAQS
jgi:membrane-associated phospholipid phosphatase